MFAKDLMDTRFQTLHPRHTVAETVSAFQHASDSEGKKIFGMMVTDDADRLVGMLSMFDILNYVQRLFVREKDDAGSFSITGVLALSDSARFRSGSCRACTAGRLLIR